MLRRVARSGWARHARCPARSRCRAPSRSRAARTARIPVSPCRPAAAGPSAAADPSPRGGSRTRGCDRRRARICSSAPADCRGGTICRRCGRDGCRRRNPCSRRSRRGRASCSRRPDAAAGRALPRSSRDPARSHPGCRPTRCRSARRAGAPRASSGLSVDPAAASAASRAAPLNRPASSAPRRSRISSPIAMPPRAASPSSLNTPSGRFWMGKCGCSLADSTQLRRPGSCVASVIVPRGKCFLQTLPACIVIGLTLRTS